MKRAAFSTTAWAIPMTVGLVSLAFTTIFFASSFRTAPQQNGFYPPLPPAPVHISGPFPSTNTIPTGAPTTIDGPTPTPTSTPTPTPTCSASPPVLQGFDNITNIIPAGWFMRDNSQPGPGTIGWFQGDTTVFAAQSGNADSYIAANSNNGTGTSTLSNWLLTPPMILAPDTTMSFWTRTVDAPTSPDRLQLRMSTNGASANVGTTAFDVGDFATLLLDINPTYTKTDYPNVWTQYTVSAPGITTQVRGRFAFRYFVENGGPGGVNSDYIGIDSVEIDPGCGGSFATPTPVPSPTPFYSVVLWEGFDDSAPPALPSGWHSSFTTGPADCAPNGTCAFGSNWITTTSNPADGPNSAFHDAPPCVTDSALDSPAFFLQGGCPYFATFVHSYNLESGRDGGVLEISINGGPFIDIVQAGGTVNYNGTILSGFQSPIAGRSAWTGDSGGHLGASIRFPEQAIGQSIVLRFRLATDCSGGVSGMGWYIDSIDVTVLNEMPCPPLVISGTVGNCSSPAPTATPPATPTPPTLPPVPNVRMTLNGSATGTTLTNASGNYSFTVNAGRTYTVTASKGPLAPGGTGINIQDVLAVQRHSLGLTIIPGGCRLQAADVNNSGTINIQDVLRSSGSALGLLQAYLVLGNTSSFHLTAPTRPSVRTKPVKTTPCILSAMWRHRLQTGPPATGHQVHPKRMS